MQTIAREQRGSIQGDRRSGSSPPVAAWRPTAEWTAGYTMDEEQPAAEAASFLWSAPSSAGTNTMTARPTGGTAGPCVITMTRVQPSSMVGTKVSDDGIAAGKAGAGMILSMKFLPTNVSFSFAEWLE